MVGCTSAQAIQTVPCVAKKAEWAQRWIGSGSSFAERLVGFACVEGICSSQPFALDHQNILSCMKKLFHKMHAIVHMRSVPYLATRIGTF